MGRLLVVVACVGEYSTGTLAWGRRRQPRGILRGAPADVLPQRLRGGDGLLEHALELGDVLDTQLEDSLRPVHGVVKGVPR